jgi:DNA-binding transcriptional MerR regulator
MPYSALQIGEVAARAGVSVDTIRYYERRKLIKRASRSVGGFRLFAPEAIERIKFIKQAQELGFSLDEVREFLTDGDGINECRRVRDLLSSKISEIDERMKKMREFRRVLQSNLTACEREIEEHGKEAHCPVIVNIERKN